MHKLFHLDIMIRGIALPAQNKASCGFKTGRLPLLQKGPGSLIVYLIYVFKSALYIINTFPASFKRAADLFYPDHSNRHW